MKWKE